MTGGGPARGAGQGTARRPIDDRGAEGLHRMATAEVGPTDYAVVHDENKLELRRYDPAERRHGTPILIVYALVNRPFVLDLQPDRSVVRRLLEAGFVVYLVDWGEPSRLDRSLALADYVCRYLDDCVDAVCADADVEDVHLLGYCMGGTLATMYAALHGERVRTLGLLATPISGAGSGGVLERWATHCDPDVLVGARGNVPGGYLAALFALTDPVENLVAKYLRLFENREDDDFVETFARVERWVWDGVDVPGEAFREFVTEVYRNDALMNDECSLDGRAVRLGDVDVPVLQVVGEDDHLVPSAASEPLHDRIASDDDRLLAFPAGHVGLTVSSAANDRLWPAVADWFAARSAGDPAAGDAEEKVAVESRLDEVSGQ